MLSIGRGIGGFIGGQLLDNAGWSMALLFKVTAAVLFVSTLCLYFVYKIFCTKYEEQLIKLKEDEMVRQQEEKEEHAKDSLEIDRNQENVGHSSFNNDIGIKDMKDTKYGASQIVGKSRF